MNEKQTELTLESKMLRPTKKQKELLGYIETFIAEHGYSPSYREIMNGLEYTSVATVALHVRNLIARGHLRKREHSARSLEVVHHDELASTAPLRTNEVKAHEEKWLVEKVENLFAEAETAPLVQQAQLDSLYVLLAALRVLDLEGAAQSFAARMTVLKSKLREAKI
jgi:SOS-response transcriptional repressor LexA